MATKHLLLSIIACETSIEEIRELIADCQVCKISGTVNTKYQDYAAETILEELSSDFNVIRAERLEDDGASMLEVQIFVPDEQKNRLEKWIAENHMNGESPGALQDFSWGVEIGDSVEMPDPTPNDSWNHSFQGNVIGFRHNLVEVEDGDGDVFGIEPERLSTD